MSCDPEHGVVGNRLHSYRPGLGREMPVGQHLPHVGQRCECGADAWPESLDGRMVMWDSTTERWWHEPFTLGGR